MTIGRNEKCPCGSGKKYKRCCISKDKSAEQTSLPFSPFDDEPFLQEPEYPSPPQDRHLTIEYLLNTTTEELESYLEPHSSSDLKYLFDDNQNRLQFKFTRMNADEISLHLKCYSFESIIFINLETGYIKTNTDHGPAIFALHAIYHKRAPFSFKKNNSSKSEKIEWWKREPNASDHAPTTIWNEHQEKEIKSIHFILHQLYDKRTVDLTSIAIGYRDDFSDELSHLLQKIPKLKKDYSYTTYFTGTRYDEAIKYSNDFGALDEFDDFENETLNKLSFDAIFSDKTRISLDSRPSHPYMLLLPKELLITEDWLKTQTTQYYDYSSGLSQMVTNFYLDQLDQLKNLNKFIYTTDAPNLGLPIRSITAIPKESHCWEISSSDGIRIEFRGELAQKELTPYIDCESELIYNPKTQEAFIHDLGQQIFEISSHGLRETKHKTNEIVLHTESTNQANLTIQYLLKENASLHFPKLQTSPPSEPKANIYFNPKESQGVSLELQVGSSQSRLLPYNIEDMLEGINSNLFSIHRLYPEELTKGLKGITQSHEIKLLSHRGFSLFILSHLLSGIIENQSKKMILESLPEKSRTIASQIIHGVKSEIKDTYSKSFLTIFNNTIDILKEPKFFYFFNQNKTYQLDYKKYYNPLYLSCIQFLISKDNKRSFLKSKSSKFNIKENYFFDEEELDEVFSEKNPRPSMLTCPSFYPDLMPFIPNDFNIHLNETPLEKLSDEDFQTLLQLKSQSEGEDWFELDPKFYFKGQEISPKEALNFTQGNFIPFQGKLYQIDQTSITSLRWLNLLWDQLQIGDESKGSSASHKIASVHRSSSLELLAWRAAGLIVKGDKTWNSICDKFDTLSNNIIDPKAHSFPEINAPLKDHQKVGLRWMIDLYDLGLGGILADDMGLGKTLQVLSFIEVLRLKNKLGFSLIVVPTSLVYNWVSESTKFTPDCPITIFEAKLKKDWPNIIEKRDNGVLLCSYGLFVRHSDFFETQDWNLVFFDEAQSLKNITSKRTSAARKLKAKSKFCITGTPMENHFGEFFSLIDLSVPGSLGSYKKFMEVYGPKSKKHISTANIEFLKLKTAPLVLRRDKATILKDLPSKTENTVLIPFETQQQKIYKDIAISFNQKVHHLIEEKGESRSQLEMLTALLRLRQVCSCPSSLPKVTYTKVPPKINVMLEQVESLISKGESVLVFTNFVSTLHYIKELFENHNHSPLSIHGGVSMNKRKEILEIFEKSTQPSILLMTLKTGGVGLNLTKANHVFHLEPWWNPAAENQGTDRVHRMGQTKHVHVVRFIMQNSIEEKIQNLKLKKSKSFDTLFSESLDSFESTEAPSSFKKQNLTKKDFELLLDLEKLPKNRKK